MIISHVVVSGSQLRQDTTIIRETQVSSNLKTFSLFRSDLAIVIASDQEQP